MPCIWLTDTPARCAVLCRRSSTAVKLWSLTDKWCAAVSVIIFAVSPAVRLRFLQIQVEEKADELMPRDPDEHVAFLVIGDPFGATTHTDLMMRAKAASVEVVVVHNASIMNAVGCCGLQLYTYGQSVSICFFTETWRPDSFYEKVAVNRREGLHTLCLLDIKVKEPNLEALARGKMVRLLQPAYSRMHPRKV
eukprot:SAG31_NODE_239_length_19453_cov_5.539888_13_plen_193_part_00